MEEDTLCVRVQINSNPATKRVKNFTCNVRLYRQLFRQRTLPYFDISITRTKISMSSSPTEFNEFEIILPLISGIMYLLNSTQPTTPPEVWKPKCFLYASDGNLVLNSCGIPNHVGHSSPSSYILN